MKKINIKHQILNYKNVLLVVLFSLAFLERTVIDFGPNFELITTALVLSSFYVGKKESFWIVFLIMLFSDLVIGNTNIFVFTWSGFLLPAIFIKNLINKTSSLVSLKTKQSSSFTKKVTSFSILTLTGLSTNIFFFLWTNFGVWLLTGMYPKTSLGLLMSYVNALPFLRYQFISTLIFIPVGFLLTETAIVLANKYQSDNKFITFPNIQS